MLSNTTKESQGLAKPASHPVRDLLAVTCLASASFGFTSQAAANETRPVPDSQNPQATVESNEVPSLKPFTESVATTNSVAEYLGVVGAVTIGAMGVMKAIDFVKGKGKGNG